MRQPWARLNRRRRSKPSDNEPLGPPAARSRTRSSPSFNPNSSRASSGYPGIRSTAAWAIISAARTVLW